MRTQPRAYSDKEFQTSFLLETYVIDFDYTDELVTYPGDRDTPDDSQEENQYLVINRVLAFDEDDNAYEVRMDTLPLETQKKILADCEHEAQKRLILEV